jgi:uncharacterized protein YbcI
MSDGQGAAERIAPPLQDGARSNLLEISNTIVGLHKQYYGRGPTKARTTLARDVLVVVLEGGFSQAEQTLVASGRGDEVQSGRNVLQGVVKERWIESIEGLLGRHVRAFLSATDPVHEIQVETFILEPDESRSDGVAVHPLEAARDGSESHD